MNMNMLMQKAQKMQNDIQKSTEEVSKKVFTGKQELVEVEMTGNKVITKVTLSENISSDDKEILEDMILLAVNDAMGKIDKELEEKLGKYKGIPGLF